jgi:hypothetical protein
MRQQKHHFLFYDHLYKRFYEWDPTDAINIISDYSQIFPFRIW